MHSSQLHCKWLLTLGKNKTPFDVSIFDMAWLLPLNAFAFVCVVISLLQAESCLKHSECFQVSSRHYCCRGRCITRENRTKEDKCVPPLRTKSADDFIVIGVCTPIAVGLIAIICYINVWRCSCYKRRSPEVSDDTVARRSVNQTSAALTTVTLSSPGLVHPETGLRPQGNRLQESLPYLPPYAPTGFSGIDKDQQREKKELPREAPPPYTVWTEGSVPR